MSLKNTINSLSKEEVQLLIDTHDSLTSVMARTPMILTEIERKLAIDLIHDSEMQTEIMNTPNHQYSYLLDYVFDQKLQKQLFEQPFE